MKPSPPEPREPLRPLPRDPAARMRILRVLLALAKLPVEQRKALVAKRKAELQDQKKAAADDVR